jgi:hypothetical protein
MCPVALGGVVLEEHRPLGRADGTDCGGFRQSLERLEGQPGADRSVPREAADDLSTQIPDIGQQRLRHLGLDFDQRRLVAIQSHRRAEVGHSVEESVAAAFLEGVEKLRGDLSLRRGAGDLLLHHRSDLLPALRTDPTLLGRGRRRVMSTGEEDEADEGDRPRDRAGLELRLLETAPGFTVHVPSPLSPSLGSLAGRRAVFPDWIAAVRDRHRSGERCRDYAEWPSPDQGNRPEAYLWRLFDPLPWRVLPAAILSAYAAFSRNRLHRALAARSLSPVFER